MKFLPKLVYTSLGIYFNLLGKEYETNDSRKSIEQ